MDCIFCSIISREIPAKFVYEDEKTIAIVPLVQVSRGHTLLFPKEHFVNIFDIDEELIQYVAKVLKQLSVKLVSDWQATGINILSASGKDAQQSVFHMHFHLVPRYPNDALDLWIKQKL